MFWLSWLAGVCVVVCGVYMFAWKHSHVTVQEALNVKETKIHSYIFFLLIKKSYELRTNVIAS